MGFIIDNEDLFDDFKDLINEDYFIDKSNIINEFNKCINKKHKKYVCITKPRRFGKTSIASMLVTYYSKGIDSKEIFDRLKVSKGLSSDKEIKQLEIKQYNEFQRKYHTLFFDFSKNIFFYEHLNDYLASINDDLKEDFEELNPSLKLLKKYNNNIIKNLQKFYKETKEKFILIIDEWDYIISNKKFSIEERNNYISFLCSLIKDKGYIAFVYMTGILPIAKELSQSTLNCFCEYSMLEDEKYYQYFGFTEEEVRALSEKHETLNSKKNKTQNKTLSYETLENWYNGYRSYNGEKIFNTWSVIQALLSNSIKNYWSNSGRYDEVIRVINFEINGVKDDILDLINGKKISIKLENYGAEDLLEETRTDKPKNNDEKKNDGEEGNNEKKNDGMKDNNEKKNDGMEDNNEKKNNEMGDNDKKKNDGKKDNDDMKEELYSKMVSFGFLTYYNGEISIPNNELKEKFIKVLKKKKDMKFLYDLLENSENMLKATLEKKAEEMCKIMEIVHMEKIKPTDKVDHGNLKRVVEFAYFSAKSQYNIEEEKSSGKGIADFIFYPKEKSKTVIIFELKTEGPAKNAINQIHERKYYQNINEEEYIGNVLLIGMNFEKKNKTYSCLIEEYDSVSSLKLTISKNKRNNKSKNKRTNEPDHDSDSIYKRLRRRRRNI